MPGQDVNVLQNDMKEKEELNLVVDMTRFREDPLQFMKTLTQHVLGSSWRGYDEYVGHSLYYPGITEEMLQQTMSHPLLQKQIAHMADVRMQKEISWTLTADQRLARRSELVGWISSIAETHVRNTMASFDHKSVLRFLYYVVAQIFARCYHQGVHVKSDEVAMIKAKAKELAAKKQSLVFLPCHKSHIDYMALHFICFRMGISLPVVVAGENLNFAVVGPMLKQVGAMYIKRSSWSQDPLYQTVVQSFIETVLSQGYNFECFIEGTRSRSGKLLPPKFGVLKYILDAILTGAIQDTWIAPVSTQYDKVVEAETYATELLGKEKKQESFMSFIDSRKILSLQMGRVDVRFGQPWSLKSWIVEQLANIEPSLLLSNGVVLNCVPPTPQQDTDKRSDISAISPNSSAGVSSVVVDQVSFPLKENVDSSVHTHLLRSLGYRVLNDINKASVVMPTSLVGTVLLTWASRGISFEQLVARVDWLIVKVQQAGGKVGTLGTENIALHETEEYPHFKDTAAVVANALKVLGPDLVGTEQSGLLEITYFPKDPFKLSYYRNQVIHLFVSEAIVSVAIFTQLRRTGNRIMATTDIVDGIKFLSTLLSGEFVYQPEGFEANLHESLHKLSHQGVITSDYLTSDVIELSVNELNAGCEYLDFYCFLLWPFIDGYWAASVGLLSLSQIPAGVEVPERQFYDLIQSLAKTLYFQGEITHYEAVNKEMLKAAYQHFEAQGIVNRNASNRSLHITHDWRADPAVDGRISPGRLTKYSEDIAIARNRPLRHGVTPALNQRVVHHAAMLAKKLSGVKL